MGIEVLPRSNLSQKEFTVENGRIIFGLVASRTLGPGRWTPSSRNAPATGLSPAFWIFSRDRLPRGERKVAESLIITAPLTG